MKFLLALLCCVGFSLMSKADQLSFLSKEDATRAASFIQTQKWIYLYCGCCDYEKPVKIKPTKAAVAYTGTEDYYEVIVTYKGKKYPLDFAYVWYKTKKAFETVGSYLHLQHDKCKDYGQQ